MPTFQAQKARAVVEAIYEAYAKADLPAVMTYMSDDVRFAQYFADPELPFTGVTSGRSSFQSRLDMILKDWQFVEYTPTMIAADGETVRSNCHFVVQHRKTYENFDGTFRHVWKVNDGKVAELEEYLDIERFRSFLRL